MNDLDDHQHVEFLSLNPEADLRLIRLGNVVATRVSPSAVMTLALAGVGFKVVLSRS